MLPSLARSGDPAARDTQGPAPDADACFISSAFRDRHDDD
jgi:hypothetical protein